MRKQTLCLFSFLLFVTVSVCAQDILTIKKNPLYVWGQGTAETLQAADDNAVRDLISQITVNIDSQTRTVVSNDVSEDSVSSSVSMTGDLRVSSNVSLSNCKRIVQDMGTYFLVLRYVERAEIDRMFDARKAKINDLIAAGERAESTCKVGDALRNYYWALKLITSIPNEHRIALTNDDGVLLATYVHEQIVSILDSTIVSAVKKRESEGKNMVELSFTYKGKSVSSCDYSFFDGYDWLIASVKDGVAVVDMPSDAAYMLLRIEYEFRKIWKSDPMVNDVMVQLPTRLPFPQFEKQVNISIAEAQGESLGSSAGELARGMMIDSLAGCNKQDINMQADVLFPVLQAMEDKSYDGARESFTDNGWKWFEKLVKYGNARLLESDSLQLTSFANGFLIRGVKASFSFKRNDKSFVEDLVFYVKDGKIDWVNFGLEKDAVDDIARHGMWNAESRLVLINFLENYKTAYALERLDYLNAVFSDDALIIVGNKIPQTKASDVAAIDRNSYQHNKLTKGQYMKQLERVFAKQEYVNIHFEDASVKKTNRTTERYEIIIKQNYYSTTYADKGYLYLLADITNPEQPVIYVRVWDENKNNLMDYGEWIF